MIGAIEAGGTKFVLAICSEAGQVTETRTIPTLSPEKTFAEVTEFFDYAQHSHGALSAIGVGSFGPIDIDPHSDSYGVLGETPKPGWSGVSMVEPLHKFGIPIALETDVNCAARGEWLCGAGQGCATLAYVTVGTGVGVAVLLEGNPVNGCGHLEGGHIRVPRHLEDRDFAGCCPSHGDCLEGLASGMSIGLRWGKPLSDLDDQVGALQIEAHYLAELSATLTFLHRPSRIIFGGGVMQTAGLLESVKKQYAEKLGGYVELPCPLQDYLVLPGCKEAKSALLGCANFATLLPD